MSESVRAKLERIGELLSTFTMSAPTQRKKARKLLDEALAQLDEQGEWIEGWAVEDCHGIQRFGTDKEKLKHWGDMHALHHNDWEVYLRPVVIFFPKESESR